MAIDGELGFDLEETLEDIGNFLESWDVERDMRSSGMVSI
jgi:hypothetical protein